MHFHGVWAHIHEDSSQRRTHGATLLTRANNVMVCTSFENNERETKRVNVQHTVVITPCDSFTSLLCGTNKSFISAVGVLCVNRSSPPMSVAPWPHNAYMVWI